MIIKYTREEIVAFYGAEEQEMSINKQRLSRTAVSLVTTCSAGFFKLYHSLFSGGHSSIKSYYECSAVILNKYIIIWASHTHSAKVIDRENCE